MTIDQLNYGENLNMRIGLLEGDLFKLNSEYELIKIGKAHFHASVGSCSAQLSIHNFVSYNDIYSMAIAGVTKQIKQLKKEFKDL